MAKEGVVYILIYTMEYYSAIKNNEIMPFVANEGSQRKIVYDTTYMWNLKYDTNELIYNTKTDSQT